MHPCVRCKKKGKCPDKCYPKKDYERHLEKLNKHLNKQKKVGTKHEIV